MSEQDAPLTLPEEATSAGEMRDQHLQRRVLRLLLQHHEVLFRQQFRLFFTQSALPSLPLLQQYDRFMKLRMLGGELLNDIMPRIRRELSLHTDHRRLREEAPTRGDIDWPRTLERAAGTQPGLPPQQFETRLRLRTQETPENLLVVVLLLDFRRDVQMVLREQFRDEELSSGERQILVGLDEQAERELAAPAARMLIKQAGKIDPRALSEQVAIQLRPGASPYRDLLAWWGRYLNLRVGRAAGMRSPTLSSTRSGEKTGAWLYELWIALELLHLLSQEADLQPGELTIATDILQGTFTWQRRRFRLLYNRQLESSTSYEPAWQHAPATRPDYTIERAEPMEIRHGEQLIWREPPVVLDAKYYLEGSDPASTHLPIKKLLGDMTLLGAQVGALFFPRLPEPQANQQVTRTLQSTGQQHPGGQQNERQIQLYHLEPQMDLAQIQARLRAILDFAAAHLPERPAPACLGMILDRDTLNAGGPERSPRGVLCPKPHIGPGVCDLVSLERDCMKNPRLCHVLDQAIVPPFVLRVLTREELEHQSQLLRTQSQERLRAAETAGDEERAEQIRQYIFSGIGRAVEHYVSLFGNTMQSEDMLRDRVFCDYWEKSPRALHPTTRTLLISGDHIWEKYRTANVLQDWAAPAIQYWRALEYEVKRRLYSPIKHFYPDLQGSDLTLGTITRAYDDRHSDGREKAIWQVMLSRVAPDNRPAFEKLIERLSKEKIQEKRKRLAHAETVDRKMAEEIHDLVLGSQSQQSGILPLLAELVDVR